MAKKSKSQVPDKKPIQPTLKAMKFAERQDFPISMLSSVKSSCTTVSLEMNFSFKTKVNRNANTIEVTRIA